MNMGSRPADARQQLVVVNGRGSSEVMPIERHRLLALGLRDLLKQLHYSWNG